MIAVSPRGQRLLEHMRVPEEHLRAVRPVFATVIVRHHSSFLFVYNRQRQGWEFPGGWLDPGETGRACAQREFEEETSQTLSELVFQGLIKVQPAAGHPYLIGALFSGVLAELRPFVANEEVSELRFLSGEEQMIDPVDRALLEFVSVRRG